MMGETLLEKCKRYEATLRAIAASTLCGTEFGDWVQTAVEDALDGEWPECPECGTAVHEGACVAEAVAS